MFVYNLTYWHAQLIKMKYFLLVSVIHGTLNGPPRLAQGNSFRFQCVKPFFCSLGDEISLQLGKH